MDEKKRCWVDGSVQCPYGHPDGQFLLRPSGFCGQKCLTFNNSQYAIEDTLCPEDSGMIVSYFDKHSISLSSKLDRLAAALENTAHLKAFDALQAAACILRTPELKDYVADSDALTEDELPEW